MIDIGSLAPTSIRQRFTSDRAYILAVTGLALVAGIAAAAIVGRSTAIQAILVVGVITALQWVLLSRSSKQTISLPALAVAGLNVVGVAGWLFFPTIQAEAAVSASLPESADVYNSAGLIFASASVSVFVGGIVASLMCPASKDVRLGAGFKASVEFAERLPSARLAAASVVPLAILILAYSPSALMERDHYSAAAGSVWLVRLGSLLAPAGIALAALVIMRARGMNRGFAVGVYTAYTCVIFAMGSRLLAVVPLMLLLVWLSTKRPRMGLGLPVSGFAVALSYLCLAIPLTTRGLGLGAGVIPYTRFFSEHPGALLQFNVAGVCGNILFSVPLTGTVATQLSTFPLNWLYTSINPLPSSLTPWAEILPHLRLNQFTPTNALGELANYGPAYFVGFFGLLGLALGVLQALNSRLSPSLAGLATVVGFGLTSVLTLDLLQYNLRTGTRFVWYFVLISIVLHLVNRFQFDKSKP